MEDTNVIKVVDDIMGSGKTTWAINYINCNTDKRFLVVVPLLDECERIKKYTKIDIHDPQKSWGWKGNHFRKMVEQGENIVTTHALIKKIDLDLLELLKSKEYILIIDECLEVLSPHNISKDDVDILFNERLIEMDSDGFMFWNEERNTYRGKYDDIKRLCNLRSLMGFKKRGSEDMARILMWSFSIDFFKCFQETFILTYLWDGSIQKAFFDIHGIQYEKYMLDGNVLIKHNKDLELQKRRTVSGLINVYEGKFNRIGEKIGKVNPLTKTWYTNKKRKNDEIIKSLKSNTENYFRTITKTESKYNMYTVFKTFEVDVKGKGYAKGFVPCNAKGTNEFKDKKAVAYLVNFYLPPEIKQFVNHYNFEFDEELFALSAMLQWIWRSQIRDGKPINIYVPSERMRRLLKQWIAEYDQQLENAA